jgi:hypothetical protein
MGPTPRASSSQTHSAGRLTTRSRITDPAMTAPVSLCREAELLVASRPDGPVANLSPCRTASNSA